MASLASVDEVLDSFSRISIGTSGLPRCDGKKRVQQCEHGAAVGVLESPLLGKSNALTGAFFSSPATNRSVDLQMIFNFWTGVSAPTNRLNDAATGWGRSDAVGFSVQQVESGVVTKSR